MAKKENVPQEKEQRDHGRVPGLAGGGAGHGPVHHHVHSAGVRDSLQFDGGHAPDRRPRLRESRAVRAQDEMGGPPSALSRNQARRYRCVPLSGGTLVLYVVKRIMGVPATGSIYAKARCIETGKSWPNRTSCTKGPVFYDPYRDNFPAVPPSEAYNVSPDWQLLMRSTRRRGGHRDSQGQLLRHGRQPRRQPGQPLLGIHSKGECDRPPHVCVLVI